MLTGEGKEVAKENCSKHEEKKKPKKGDTPVLRYIKTQVSEVMEYA